MPVVGFLSARSYADSTGLLVSFRKGLTEGGYVEGQNVRIEYRFAEGQYDRLAGLAKDLVGRQVVVIAAIGGTPARSQQKLRLQRSRSCLRMGLIRSHPVW
jgi:putative tryptophan/tyrosine transport system substrate-binding protein